MLKELLQPEISELIADKNWSDIKDIIVLWPPAETASLIGSFSNNDKLLVFRLLQRDYAAEVFSEMKVHEQENLINAMKDSEISILLGEMTPDDRTSLFEELPANVTKHIFKLLKGQDLKIATKLLGYPPESVGRLMTPEYIDANENWDVKTTLENIKKKGKDSETFEIVYVTDSKDKLMGLVTLRSLFFSDPKSKIEDIMDANVVSISAYDDQEKAIPLIKQHNIVSLPVVDSKNTLLGIVTVDDIMDVAEEEYTEDFHKLAAISPTHGYFDEDIKIASIKNLYMKRVPWLVILIVVNIFSGAVIGLFEEEISKYIVLVFFMPLLVGSGGNAGGQASTLVIRALATGDINTKDWLVVFLRECAISFLLGLTMALAVSLIGVIRGGVWIALIVALSMTSIVIVGSLVGLCLPFIFTKFKIDPASSSSPLVTSICDIIGIAIYLGIATSILK